jgi:hypothetical protein
MTISGQNVDIIQGESRKVEVTVTDQNGNLLDISNSAICWAVFKQSDSVFTKTVDNGIKLTDPTKGIFEITVAHEDTLNLIGSYKHECRLTDIDGNSSVIFTGSFNVFASKTN